MVSDPKTRRYADALYQDAHDDMFSKPLYNDIPSVLPPGVDKPAFEAALEEFADAVGGAEFVFSSKNLVEYVDPYEIPESGIRNLPSAAVWYDGRGMRLL